MPVHHLSEVDCLQFFFNLALYSASNHILTKYVFVDLSGEMTSAQGYQVKYKTNGPVLRAINAKSYSPIICRIRAAHLNDLTPRDDPEGISRNSLT